MRRSLSVHAHRIPKLQVFRAANDKLSSAPKQVRVVSCAWRRPLYADPPQLGAAALRRSEAPQSMPDVAVSLMMKWQPAEEDSRGWPAGSLRVEIQKF